MAGICPIYKVIIIGDSGVGKTTLFHRILFGTFIDTSENNRSTIGLDCFEKTVNVLGQNIGVELHDCQGRERFRTRNISNLYHRADAVILAYCPEDLNTFENLPIWIEECKDNLWGSSGREVVWALVSTKSDLDHDHLIDLDRVEDLCDTLETNLHFSVSAKTGNNVEKTFKNIIESLHEHKLQLSNGRKSSFVLNNKDCPNKKTCCTT